MEVGKRRSLHFNQVVCAGPGTKLERGRSFTKDIA